MSIVYPFSERLAKGVAVAQALTYAAKASGLAMNDIAWSAERVSFTRHSRRMDGVKLWINCFDSKIRVTAEVKIDTDSAQLASARIKTFWVDPNTASFKLYRENNAPGAWVCDWDCPVDHFAKAIVDDVCKAFMGCYHVMFVNNYMVPLGQGKPCQTCSRQLECLAATAERT